MLLLPSAGSWIESFVRLKNISILSNDLAQQLTDLVRDQLAYSIPPFLGSSEENSYFSAEFFSVVPNEVVVHFSTTDATASSQSAGPYSGLKNSFQIL
jgi:hypothetical protein